MSSYENYSSTSAHYDTTREPIGVAIILGCMARGGRPLVEQTLLDAGCGQTQRIGVTHPSRGDEQGVTGKIALCTVHPGRNDGLSAILSHALHRRFCAYIDPFLLVAVNCA